MIIAATGHRPDKLGGYTLPVRVALFRLAREYLALADVDRVISGMALGWDMAVAEAACHLGIPLIAAVPFRGQERRWSDADRARYFLLLKRAEAVRTLSTGAYAPWKFQMRNEWMVHRATHMLALWNGSSGGTANCMDYAAKLGVPCENLWPEWWHIFGHAQISAVPRTCS